MTACQTSASQAARFLVGEGAMRAIDDTRMQMRFELQSRPPSRGGWRAVAAPGFGVWNTALPGVRRYAYSKRVEALAAPADYRMVVRFRWLRRGRPAAQVKRVTRVCSQPDPRPDLVVARFAMKGGNPADRRYVVRLDNRGGAPSGPFEVAVSVNGASLAPVAVAGLAAGARVKVQLRGPGCRPGSTVLIRVDPGGRVGERDEGNNELVQPCAG